jgi:hypothetical protein
VVWTVYDFSTKIPSCPYCDRPLSESSDLWGVFYACNECGYEVEAPEASLELKQLEHRRLVRQAIAA